MTTIYSREDLFSLYSPLHTLSLNTKIIDELIKDEPNDWILAAKANMNELSKLHVISSSTLPTGNKKKDDFTQNNYMNKNRNRANHHGNNNNDYNNNKSNNKLWDNRNNNNNNNLDEEYDATGDPEIDRANLDKAKAEGKISKNAQTLCDDDDYVPEWATDPVDNNFNFSYATLDRSADLVEMERRGIKPVHSLPPPGFSAPQKTTNVADLEQRFARSNMTEQPTTNYDNSQQPELLQKWFKANPNSKPVENKQQQQPNQAGNPFKVGYDYNTTTSAAPESANAWNTPKQQNVPNLQKQAPIQQQQQSFSNQNQQVGGLNPSQLDVNDPRIIQYAKTYGISPAQLIIALQQKMQKDNVSQKPQGQEYSVIQANSNVVTVKKESSTMEEMMNRAKRQAPVTAPRPQQQGAIPNYYSQPDVNYQAQIMQNQQYNRGSNNIPQQYPQQGGQSIGFPPQFDYQKQLQQQDYQQQLAQLQQQQMMYQQQNQAQRSNTMGYPPNTMPPK